MVAVAAKGGILRCEGRADDCVGGGGGGRTIIGMDCCFASAAV